MMSSRNVARQGRVDLFIVSPRLWDSLWRGGGVLIFVPSAQALRRRFASKLEAQS